MFRKRIDENFSPEAHDRFRGILVHLGHVVYSPTEISRPVGPVTNLSGPWSSALTVS